MKLCSVLIAATIATTGAIQIDGLRAQDLVRGPDTGKSGIALLAIPGVPLTGKSTIEWKRVQTDGSLVITHETSNLARDSQGRMYRERHNMVPMNEDPMSQITEIQIFDTVKHTKTICRTQARHCELDNYYPQKHFTMAPAGWNEDHTSFLDREGLGANQLEGLDVSGVRETQTVNAGVKGNARPLVTKREFWYSESIQTNVLTTRIDPLNGTQVVRLSDVQLGEPAPEWFMVPEGYTVVDTRKKIVIADPGGTADSTRRPAYSGKDEPTAAPTEPQAQP
jgi:hypothetical protein